ncbi:MAG: LysR substrate-binding domain-containing protein [Reyranella sp.]
MRQAGAASLKAARVVRVDSFEDQDALQLGESGAGVALGLAPLFAAQEQAGRLCRPIASSHPTGGYWLVHRSQERSSPALRAFSRWLLGEVGGKT